MKLLYSFLVVLTTAANAQHIKPFIFEAGFGDFTLGANKRNFGNHIQFADSLTFDGGKDYFYVHSFETPLEIAGLQFREVLLTFDDSNHLKQIELVKIYTDTLFSDHKIKAINDQAALNQFLKVQAGKKGKKKHMFHSLEASGYEWIRENVLIWSYLLTTKAIKQKEAEIYSIHLQWKLRENL